MSGLLNLGISNSYRLEVIDLRNCPLVVTISLSRTRLRDMDLTNQTSALSIVVSNSPDLSYVKIPASASLNTLSISSCNLSSIDLSPIATFGALMLLNLDENNLSGSIDLTPFAATLQSVNLAGNALTGIIITGAVGGEEESNFEINDNDLDASALNAFFTSLGTAATPGIPYVFIAGNPGTGSCDTSIATGKGWNVNTGA